MTEFVYACGARAAADDLGKRFKVCPLAFGECLDLVVAEVAHPAAQAKCLSGTGCKSPETDSLNAARNPDLQALVRL